jgi:2-methylisocitrate lyase-like PEP mutase family enzyme
MNTGSAKELRAAIAANKPLVAPSVYDGISALAAAELNFKAVYIGSYATGATKYGVPDTGYIAAEDMADQVRRIAPLVGVPMIVDGEGGWGNPLHVAHSVRLLERAGAAAIHIEDHEFGKHIDYRSRVLPLPAAVDKIKAALDARESEALMIIGRTDATFALSHQETLARAVAFQEAGADAVFLAGYGFSSDAEGRSSHKRSTFLSLTQIYPASPRKIWLPSA